MKENPIPTVVIDIKQGLASVVYSNNSSVRIIIRDFDMLDNPSPEVSIQTGEIIRDLSTENWLKFLD